MAGVSGGLGGMKPFIELTRPEFVALKKQYVHPSSEVSQPDQLIGRDKTLNLMQAAFEREGANVFIWGRRGVGKTSLAHSAIAKFSDAVSVGPAVGCERNSTPASLFQDIARRAIARNKSLISSSSLKLKLEALGLSVEGQLGGFRPSTEISSINQASELLGTLFPADFERGRKTAVIIDEFDQLNERSTIDFLTSLAKQMSVDAIDVKLVFCGVAANLEALIGSHESVGRYIAAVRLDPLTDDNIWSIVERIVSEFGLVIHRGQLIRIGQIACGYPTFAHLIADEILNVAFETRMIQGQVMQDVFNEAMRRAAASAATHLQGAYEAATMKGTDRYVEVLWSAAHGPHIKERQFKDVNDDYFRIMASRSGRKSLGSEKNVRNHLNALCSDANGAVLERLKTGWYRFKDPMFRGYVRMIAYNEGVELGDESFQR
jgi:hypothetical protein